jgi:hypothetical protein
MTGAAKMAGVRRPPRRILSWYLLLPAFSSKSLRKSCRRLGIHFFAAIVHAPREELRP